MIPGIRGADGPAGPPLTAMARRAYVAGRIPNVPERMVQWVMSPRSLDEATVMPALGLIEPEARDVAAYLYTLR